MLLADMGIHNVEFSSSLIEGFRTYRKMNPDVVIVDLSMGTRQLSGLDFIHRVRLHDDKTALLVLTMHADEIVVRRAIKSGANGFLLKDTSAEEFERALGIVSKGERYLTHDLASQIVFPKSGSAASRVHDLSVRDLQTLLLIAEGRRYDEIAQELHVSYKTVVNTVSSLKGRFDVKSTAELMRAAIKFLPNHLDR